MLVVLPTHNGDRHLAVNLCAHIARLGGVQNHECLIVTPQETNLAGIEDVLRGAFGKVFILRYTETMRGWPYGANEVAAVAMIHVYNSQELQYHYLMLEPDCVPTTKFWLDMLDMDYRRCGQPVLGVRIPTVEIATNRQVGNHVVGVAVYPNNFAQLCPLVRNLIDMTNQYRMQNSMPMPWDAYFGPYTSRMTAETTLIQHLARVRHQSPAGEIRWDCPSLEHAMGQANKQAVLVHGSKDPAFLTTLTGEITHAPQQVRNEPARIEDARHDEKEVVRESGQPPRSAGSQEHSRRPEEKQQQEVDGWPLLDGGYAENAKVRARQMREREETRKQLGIAYPIDTAPFKRAVYLSIELGWPKLKQHAAALEVLIFKRKKGQVVNDVVAKEIEQGKEEWTKGLKRRTPVKEAPLKEAALDTPVELMPPVPTGSFGLSNSNNGAHFHPSLNVKYDVSQCDANNPQGVRITPVTPPAEESKISDARAQQMRQLLQSRGLLTA